MTKITIYSHCNDLSQYDCCTATEENATFTNAVAGKDPLSFSNTLKCAIFFAREDWVDMGKCRGWVEVSLSDLRLCGFNESYGAVNGPLTLIEGDGLPL